MYTDIKKWMKIVEGSNTQLKNYRVYDGVSPSNVIHVDIGTETFDLIEDSDKTILRGRLPIDFAKIQHPILDDELSSLDVMLDYEVDFNRDAILDVRLSEYQEITEYLATIASEICDAREEDEDSDCELETTYELLGSVNYDYRRVEAMIEQKVEDFKNIVGETFEEVDLQRDGVSQSLLDISESAKNDFSVLPTASMNKLILRLKDKEFEIHGFHESDNDAEISGEVCGDFFVYTGGDQATYDEDYGLQIFSSSASMNRVRRERMCLDFESDISGHNVSVERYDSDDEDPHTIISNDLYNSIPDLPENYDEDLYPYILDTYIREYIYEMSHADTDSAEEEVEKILEWIRENIGTRFSDFYKHVSAPHDSLLDISESSDSGFSIAPIGSSGDFQLQIGNEKFTVSTPSIDSDDVVIFGELEGDYLQYSGGRTARYDADKDEVFIVDEPKSSSEYSYYSGIVKFEVYLEETDEEINIEACDSPFGGGDKWDSAVEDILQDIYGSISDDIEDRDEITEYVESHLTLMFEEDLVRDRVQKIIDFIRKNIGSSYTEFYGKVSVPDERLLDMPESASNNPRNDMRRLIDMVVDDKP